MFNFDIIFTGVIIIYIVWNYIQPFTHSIYIQQVYSYVVFALMIIIHLIYVYRNQSWSLESFTAFMIGLVLSLGSLLIWAWIKPQSFGVNHIFWILFLIGLSILLFPTLNQWNLKPVLWITGIMIGLLTVIAVYSPPRQFMSWGHYLIIALTGLIMVRIIDLLGWGGTLNQTYAWIGILTFSGFILYDTQSLLERSKWVVKPNYPVESLNIFMDAVNLFMDILGIS